MCARVCIPLCACVCSAAAAAAVLTCIIYGLPALLCAAREPCYFSWVLSVHGGRSLARSFIAAVA